MKNIRWGILAISLICGAFWGALVGLFTHSSKYGIIIFACMTTFYIFILCLSSSNSGH